MTMVLTTNINARRALRDLVVKQCLLNTTVQLTLTKCVNTKDAQMDKLTTERSTRAQNVQLAMCPMMIGMHVSNATLLLGCGRTLKARTLV